MQTPSNKRWLGPLGAILLGLNLVPLPAHAHVDTQDAVPSARGLRLGAEGVFRSLTGSTRLPSQGLPGYLVDGDPGINPRGTQLEHGVVDAAYRLDARWGAHLALGAHGADPVHVEAANVQARGTFGTTDFIGVIGRLSPALGPVAGPAGHLDRFGLMPLAKQAAFNGTWIEDGAQVSATDHWGDLDWTLDIGLWAGRRFPAANAGAVFPSLHLGLALDTVAGPLAADAFVAATRPKARGARTLNTTGAHSHAMPDCSMSISQLVCFDGRSQVTGLSVQWSPPAGAFSALTLSAATLWRRETGTLYSSNGAGDYTGNQTGSWFDVRWDPAESPWSMAWRHERLIARHVLTGQGVTVLSSEAGFDAYRPLRRDAAMLSYRFNDWARAYAEVGTESSGIARGHFAALRVLLSWGRTVPDLVP